MTEKQGLDMLKDIPGYKAILKALIKSQIQHLVEQLASHTDEECLILSASLSDASLSHLGSDFGKQFLENHDDVKKQFLGFCLKSQMQSHSSNPETLSNTDAGQSNFIPPRNLLRGGFKSRKSRPSPLLGRQRLSASPYNRPSPKSHLPSSFSSHTETLTDQGADNFDMNSEQSEQGGYSQFSNTSTDSNFPQSEQFGGSDGQPQYPSGSNVSESQGTGDSDHVIIKQEPANEEEPDFEIIGMEAGSSNQQNWEPGNDSMASDLLSNINLYQRLGQAGIHQDFLQLPRPIQAKRSLDAKPFEVKIDAILEFERGEKSKKEIADMFGIPSSTLSGWLKNADSIKEGYFKYGPKRRKKRQTEFVEIDEALLQWYYQAIEKNIPINGPIMLEQAGYISRQLGIDDFKQTTGWLSRFKERHQISFKRHPSMSMVVPIPKKADMTASAPDTSAE